MKNILQINNINFRYGNKKILNNVSFNGENGIIALLGNNGAGKTILMKILTGLKKAESGQVLLNDINLIEERKNIVQLTGYLPQNFEVYGNITGLDFLSYVADIKALNKKEKKNQIEMVVEKFNLNKVIGKSFRSYSGGYKRRLGIAQAMIGDPKLVIVDEPTVGLDPEQRFEFRNYLSEIGKDKIILISTHIIEDVEFYCDKIVIIKEGNIIFDDYTDKLIESAKNKIYTGTVSIENMKEISSKTKIIGQARSINNSVNLKVICENYIPKGFNSDIPSLEDAYVYYQGR